MPENKGRVLVTGSSVADRFMSQLADAGLEVVNPPSSFPPAVLSEDELGQALETCVAYLLGGDEIASRAALARSNELAVVSFLGVGYASFVDASAAADLDIPVTNTPGVLANSVAEFTLGLTIEARRKIIDFAESFASGDEAPQEKRSDLADHPVGVVGLGSIGTRVCEILRLGFAADVSYHSRTRKPEEEERLGLTYRSLAELLDEVETLILIVPETEETTGMISADLLAGRRNDTPLTMISPARAEVIDPAGLVKALDSGAVESAWFDGFYRDQTPATQALGDHRGVRVTPHIASLTHDARDAMSQMAVDSLLNVLRTGTDAHIVNVSGGATHG
jgi:phosphoglycerate dehydrogenase-like enzyme